MQVWALQKQHAGIRIEVSKEHVLLGAVVLQGLHFVEHITQVSQKFFLGLAEAHGILGAAFDMEWVHFIYNLALFVLLAALALAYGLHRPGSWPDRSRWYLGALAFAAGLQLYHMVEHTLKLIQHLTVACAACPGLLGTVVNLPLLHFFINIAVLIPMAVALTGFVLTPVSTESAS